MTIKDKTSSFALNIKIINPSKKKKNFNMRELKEKWSGFLLNFSILLIVFCFNLSSSSMDITACSMDEIMIPIVINAIEIKSMIYDFLKLFVMLTSSSSFFFAFPESIAS